MFLEGQVVNRSVVSGRRFKNYYYFLWHKEERKIAFNLNDHYIHWSMRISISNG